MSRASKLAEGVRIATCEACGCVHVQMLGPGDTVIAVALLAPDEALGVADLIVEGAADIRTREAGGRLRCH